jgi:hypothetical protein
MSALAAAACGWPVGELPPFGEGRCHRGATGLHRGVLLLRRTAERGRRVHALPSAAPSPKALDALVDGPSAAVLPRSGGVPAVVVVFFFFLVLLGSSPPVSSHLI